MENHELSWRERGRLWLRLGIRFVALCIGLLLLVFAVPPLFSLMMPFVLAFVMAWLLSPLVRWIQKRSKLPRGVISLLLIILLFAGVGALLFGFGYTIASEVRSLAANWAGIWGSFQATLGGVSEFLTGLFDKLPEDIGTQAVAVLDQLLRWLQNTIPNWMASMASGAGSVAMSIPAAAVAVVVFVMGWYFITADYPHVRFVLTEHLPREFRDFLSSVKTVATGAFGGYVRAQIILALIVFFILLVGFIVIGQGYSLLLAFLLAVLDFIPIVGSGTVMIPWAVIDLFTGNPRHGLELLVIWGIIALFRRVAEPKILGDQTGLSPILSLVGIYVGMRLGGVPGMILGPIVCMVAINLAKSGVFHGTVQDMGLAVNDAASLLRNRPKSKDEPDKPGKP